MPDTVSGLIFESYEKLSKTPRPHLGASEIGKVCDRALWYSFRWATDKKHPGRILRLFDRGVRAEERFFEELKRIGATVYDRDPKTNEQIRFEAHGGHFGGSCDAVARGIPYEPDQWAIVECKTHSARSFAELVKLGVKAAKPEHYVQMQIYMGLSKGIERALYIAENKDTDDLYDEWVQFDGETFKTHLERAKKIIEMSSPPPGISEDPSWYQCKFCDHKDICHKKQVAEKNCRTCAFSTPNMSGGWDCSSKSKSLEVEAQVAACDDHLFIPPLVSFAYPIDSGDGFVLYETNTQTQFANIVEGVETKWVSYCSSELSGAKKESIENESVQILKDLGAILVKED